MMTPTNIDPKDIQAHFAKYQGDKYVEGWASIWDKGDNLPWDRGFPNPALEDTLVQRAGTIGGPIAQDGERRKALVPGCGRGFDLLLFASFGYDAYGLECSAAAVEACKKEKENHSRYRVRDEKVGKGKVTFVHGDFFDDTWLKEIGVPRNGFDVIYDYTVRILTAAVGLHSVIAIIFSPLVLCVLQRDLQDASLCLRNFDVPFPTQPGSFWSFWTFPLTTI
jgi:SAM-dependent methyltransferase